jgi:hypothetical protein
MPHLLPGTKISFFSNRNCLELGKKAMLQFGKEAYQIYIPFLEKLTAD